jgi:hypothetical protein
LKENAFDVRYFLFDAGGNITPWTFASAGAPALPFSEPAWGLNVRAVQHTPTFSSEEKARELGEYTVPAPGGMVAVPVPVELAKFGITDLVLAGTGNYSMLSRKLTYNGSDPSAPVSASIKLANPNAYGAETVRGPSLLIFSNSPQDRSTSDAIFFGRVGEKSFSCLVNSTSSGGSFYFRKLTFNTGTPASLLPGTKVTVFSLRPREFQATFHFPPPPAPARPGPK